MNIHEMIQLFDSNLNSGLDIDIETLTRPDIFTSLEAEDNATLKAGAEQDLTEIARRIGKERDFLRWLQNERAERDLLVPVSLDDFWGDKLPPLKAEVISGILRSGHKMMFTGSSKSHKSFAMIHLGLCIASGSRWLVFQCKKGKVLYINAEIDGNSFKNRVDKVRMGMAKQGVHFDRDSRSNFMVLNLRGHCKPLPELADAIIDKFSDKGFTAIILDPLYKLFDDKMDENSNSDVARLCNHFDRIAEGTGASVIFAHHHSKGGQGTKKAQDRGAGAGSFARDADCLVDMLQLEGQALSMDGDEEPPEVDAYQFEFVLREFAPIKPIRAVWEYPLYWVDERGITATMNPSGTKTGARKAANTADWDAKENRFKAVFAGLNSEGKQPTVTDMERSLNISEKTFKTQAERFGFVIVDGKVWEAENAPKLLNAVQKRTAIIADAYEKAPDKTIRSMSAVSGLNVDTLKKYIRDTESFEYDRKGNVSRIKNSE